MMIKNRKEIKGMKFIKYLLFTTVLFAASLALAQPPGPPPEFEGGPMREKVRERIKTMKVWKLTEEVGLSSQQSEKFFPVYNKFQQALESINVRRNEFNDRLESLLNQPNSSDKEIEEVMSQIKDIPNQMTSETDKFQKEITPILSLRQRGKLMLFEERFKQRLQEFVREIRREMGEGGGFKGGRRMGDD